jgi:hypothetical protein
MGCHTWYMKLVTNNQEEVAEKVKEVLSISKYYSWYEFTSLEDLFESEEGWEQDIAEYITDSLIEDLINVNGVLGIYKGADGFDTDEPRIGGYPKTIITSAEEMFRAMESGLIGWKGNLCNFYWDKSRDKRIRDNITNFFKTYPDGIIQFG